MTDSRPSERVAASASHLLRRTIPFVAPYRWGIGGALGLTLITSAMDAAEPLLMKVLFDSLGSEEAMRSLSVALAALVALALARQALGAVLNWAVWRVRIGVHYNAQRAVMARLHALPLAFFRRETVGGIVSRTDRALTGYVDAFLEISGRVLPNIAYLTLSLVAMFYLDWRLFALAISLAPLPTLIGAWAAREQAVRERVLLTRWSKAYSRLHETLVAIPTVKSLGRETLERRRFMREVRETNGVVVRGVARDTTVGAVNSLIVSIGRISVAAFGGYLVLQGEATIGTVVAFLGYVGGVFGPVQGLTGVYQTVRRAEVSLETLFGILDANDPMRDAPRAVSMRHVRGELALDRVSFSYDGSSCALEEIELTIAPGETVALVGPSGAGKSTLVSLVQRFDDPSSGAIRLDGRDLRTLRLASLRAHIGAVLQDCAIFNETVFDNIACANPSASVDQVVAAARAAAAHEFIEALPDGYRTIAGERGVRFSAGQRQRIAIARAVLKDPRVLILDEATSALDTDSELLVRDALFRLARGRTTLIVAHRLATVVAADRIVVLRSGRIVETGSHDALLRAGGYYASLVEKQVRGLLPSAPVIRTDAHGGLVPTWGEMIQVAPPTEFSRP